MNSEELEQLAQTTLSQANLSGNFPLYLKAIAYFLWAILKRLEETK